MPKNKKVLAVPKVRKPANGAGEAKIMPKKRAPKSQKKFVKAQREKYKKKKGEKTMVGWSVPPNPEDKIGLSSPANIVSTQSAIQVVADWEPNALVELQYAFAAYLFMRQLPATEGFDITAFYDGLFYLFNGILVETMGQPILKTVPKIFNDIISALKPKTIKYRSGEISYSWNSPAISNQLSFIMPWGSLQPLIPVDGSTYNTLCTIYAPVVGDTGLASYTTFLGYVQGIDDMKKKCG